MFVLSTNLHFTHWRTPQMQMQNLSCNACFSVTQMPNILCFINYYAVHATQGGRKLLRNASAEYVVLLTNLHFTHSQKPLSGLTCKTPSKHFKMDANGISQWLLGQTEKWILDSSINRSLTATSFACCRPQPKATKGSKICYQETKKHASKRIGNCMSKHHLLLDCSSFVAQTTTQNWCNKSISRFYVISSNRIHKESVTKSKEKRWMLNEVATMEFNNCCQSS